MAMTSWYLHGSVQGAGDAILDTVLLFIPMLLSALMLLGPRAIRHLRQSVPPPPPSEEGDEAVSPLEQREPV